MLHAPAVDITFLVIIRPSDKCFPSAGHGPRVSGGEGRAMSCGSSVPGLAGRETVGAAVDRVCSDIMGAQGLGAALQGELNRDLGRPPGGGGMKLNLKDG